MKILVDKKEYETLKNEVSSISKDVGRVQKAILGLEEKLRKLEFSEDSIGRRVESLERDNYRTHKNKQMDFLSLADFNSIIHEMMSSPNIDGTHYYILKDFKVGKPVAVVFGWSTEYETKEKYQKEIDGTLYTLVAKIAYNCDDLQCDYDIDWYMPCYEEWYRGSFNEVAYDTDHAVNDSSYLYLKVEANCLLEDSDKYIWS